MEAECKRGSLNDSRKDAVKMVETICRAISPRKAKNANQALKREAYEELKEMYGEENIIFRSDDHSQTRLTLYLRGFCAVDQAKSIGERRDRRQKENTRTRKKIS